jgi:DNA-binding beta-propeller fold protein YncE
MASRRWWLRIAALAALGLLVGWGLFAQFVAASGTARLDGVWGRRGLLRGDFIKPRAMALDHDGNIVTVDFRAMIQTFTPDGGLVASWQTPEHKIGRPSGLCVDRDGNILVADSHYHRILVYSKEGVLLRQYGGDSGEAPLVGLFGYIGDVASDSKGFIYIAEAQQHERITKITPEGDIVAQWGERGPAPGQFQRIRSLFIDRNDVLYAADACNHRVQVFDADGRFLREFGKESLTYPYDVATNDAGEVFVCEWGTSRVRRFSRDGVLLGTWGEPGRKQGQLANPWAIAVDRDGRVLIADSDNHRVQRIVF